MQIGKSFDNSNESQKTDFHQCYWSRNSYFYVLQRSIWCTAFLYHSTHLLVLNITIGESIFVLCSVLADRQSKSLTDCIAGTVWKAVSGLILYNLA